MKVALGTPHDLRRYNFLGQATPLAFHVVMTYLKDMGAHTVHVFNLVESRTNKCSNRRYICGTVLYVPVMPPPINLSFT